MIIVQDFSRSPVARSFHSSQGPAAVRIGAPSRREIPRLLTAWGVLPLVIARHRDEAARPPERVTKERLGLDRLWMFPGGRKRARESEKDCLRREIKEELPKLRLGRVRLWKEVKAKNRRSGRKMSDAIFLARKASGQLEIGDKKEIDKAIWRKPRGIRLTPTSRYVRNKLFPN